MSSNPQHFDQFAWMRGWLATGLGQGPVAVLAVLFSHMSKAGRAWPSIPTIAAQIGCSEKTASRHISAAVESGWIARSGGDGGNYTYTATWPTPVKSTGDPRKIYATTPEDLTGVPPSDLPGAPVNFTPPPPSDLPGTPVKFTPPPPSDLPGTPVKSTGDPRKIYALTAQEQPKEQPKLTAAGQLARAAETSPDLGEEPDDELAEIFALFKIENHPISLEVATDLKTHIERFQPSALRYIEARLVDDEMGKRFDRTRALLTALRQDAMNDGASVYARRGHPDDPPPETPTPPAPPPGPNPETYRPPAAWAQALGAISSQMSTRNFEQWIRPIRAEPAPHGLRLWCPDEFAAVWVAQNFHEIISTALGTCPTYGPTSDHTTTEDVCND